MNLRMVRTTARVAAILLALTGGSVGAQTTAQRLMLADGQALRGAAYVLTLSQDVTIAGSGMQVVREARLRFRFESGERIDDARSRTTVLFDSARAAVSSPHGREVIDARRIIGSGFPLTFGHEGGPVDWATPVPAIDYGQFGGTLPVSALIDFAFPELADRSIREGEGWEANVVRRRIDGGEWTEETVVARWTLDRIETGDGAARAHVSFSMSRPDARTLEAAGSFVLEAGTGKLLELEFEETVPGTWNFNGEGLPFEQTTTLRITATDDSHFDSPDGR